MAAPIGLLLAWLGQMAAYRAGEAPRGPAGVPTAVVVGLLLAVPGLMAVRARPPGARRRCGPCAPAIDTAARVLARVWRQVVAFPQLARAHRALPSVPDVADPITATIDGPRRGRGAAAATSLPAALRSPSPPGTSPGAWHFSVAEQPVAHARACQPLTSNLQPNHLHGFFVSKARAVSSSPPCPTATPGWKAPPGKFITTGLAPDLCWVAVERLHCAPHPRPRAGSRPATKRTARPVAVR
ncbi:MAG: hypothetical protein WKG07_26680 [Hymenobacter sp.]